jgi:arylsulfatase A-like enzyme
MSTATKRVFLPLLFGALGICLFASLSCTRGTKAGPQPRLVLLYAPCTVNKSFLEPYNPSVEYTPALARFAESSVVFLRHQTEAGQSGVAFASLFTGNQAMRHGIYRHPTKLSDDLYTIAEAFRDNGYETFFWADHPMASPELNYDQGVKPENVFWQPRGPLENPDRHLFLKAEDPHFQSILRKLKSDPNYKVYLQTNFTVTHALYSKDHVPAFCDSYPDRCAGLTGQAFDKYWSLFTGNLFGFSLDFDQTVTKLGLTPAEANNVIRFVELLYQSNIHYLDTLFGAVLREIEANGLMDESLIVFTADHGEVMYRDNVALNWSHGFELSPEVHTSRVPPGTYAQPTESIDVFPTVAGLANLQLSETDLAGVDLSAAVLGKQPPPRLVALSHTALMPTAQAETIRKHKRKNADKRSDWVPLKPEDISVEARDGDIVYQIAKRDGRFESFVFDCSKDPEERHNLFDPNDATDQAMMRRLAEYKKELVEAYALRKAGGRGHLPSKRQNEILRSLGYAD